MKADFIKQLQRRWLEIARDNLAGETVRNFLNRVLRLMYIEPGQFILEFLQNAEDARMELGKKGGFFKIELFHDKVIIEHNGKPFDENDVENLCAIKSSKKPSMGYKGYIGVGWKSVFKVSSHVEVYSNGFTFAFNKKYWEENSQELKEFNLSPDQVLWQVTPIAITPTEHIPPDITRFVVHLEKPEYYHEIARTIDELSPSVFLFLEYINKIEIIDHERNKKKQYEWFVRDNGRFNDVNVQEVTLNLHEDNSTKVEKFIVFRKEFYVPKEVREDRVTIDAQRSDVMKREVAIAFGLNPNGDLRPVSEQFWGVYSFLPLHEVRSGLPFIIQADFIVHPGRRYINVEAPWNRWLMSRVAEVVKVAIRYLAGKFGHSYLTAFEYKEIGDEVYTKLIKPIVVTVIEEQLKDPTVVCIRGHTVRLSSCVKASEEVLELIKQGLISEEDLKHIYGAERHILDPNVKLRSKDRVETLDIITLLNRNFIETKLKENPDKAINLLAKIYKLAYEHKNSIPSNSRLIIITSSLSIKSTSEVFLPRLPPRMEELRKKFPEIDSYLKTLDFVHEKLYEILGNEILKHFGVNEVNFKDISRRILLPKIYASAPKPKPEDLLVITAILKESDVLPDKPIWVLTTDGNIKRSDQVYYPPQPLRDYIVDLRSLNVEFLDINKYLKYGNEEEWQRFFSVTLAKGFDNRQYMELVDRIRKLLEQAPIDTNIKYLRILKHLYEKILRNHWKSEISVKVVTDQGSIMDSEQCLLHDRYDPEEKWIRWRDAGFNIGPFVTPRYADDDPSGDISTWREFLKALGVREKASEEDVERFAEWFAQRKLEEKGCKIKNRCPKGCDFIVECNGETIYVEVKGRRKSEWVELSEGETQMAHKHGNNYWLIVVTDIPNDPKAYLAKDPLALLKKISIPINSMERL